MSEISKIKTLDNITYDIKDTTARQTIPWGEVSTASTNTIFTATVPNITQLKSGVCCILVNNKITSAANCTLNINDLGAKPIYMVNAAATRVTSQFAVNTTWMFVYNESRISGGCWDLIYLFNSNTTYSTFTSLTHGYGDGFLAASTVYRYQLLFQIDNDYVTPLNNVSNGYNSTSKAMITDVDFNPFGKFFYYNTTSKVDAGNRVSGGNSLYTATVDLRYTFNCGSSLTPYENLYLKVQPQSNGYVRIVNLSPWTQSLPTIKDGYYYILLGRTYSAYQMSLYSDHPVYYHDGTNIIELLDPKKTPYKEQFCNVSNCDELVKALSDGIANINIISDFQITTNITISNNVTINGNKHILSTSGLTGNMITITDGIVNINDIILNGDTSLTYLIFVRNNSSLKLTNSECHYSNDDIIRVYETANIIIDHCDIGYSSSNDAVAISSYSTAIINNSKMHDCYDEGFSSHMYSYVELYNCEFYNNGYVVGSKDKGAPSSFGGCHVGGGKMGIVTSCYSHDNCTYGISFINFQKDLNDDIEKCFNNLSENNGSHGYMMTYCKNLTMTNNASIGNLGDGIHFGLDKTYTPTISGIKSSGYVSGNILHSNACDDIIVDDNAYSDDLNIDKYYSTDYSNYFADPYGELLLSGVTKTTNLNYDIYKSIIMSSGRFAYSNNKITKINSTSGNSAYGCEIKYDKTIFKDTIVLSAYIEVGNASVSMYYRFFDSSGMAIGYDKKKVIIDSGKAIFKVQIPDGTASIRAWFGSSATNEWAIIAPALTTNENYIVADDRYWKIAKSSRIPNPPTTDGTYALHVTVSSGAATYSWA